MLVLPEPRCELPEEGRRQVLLDWRAQPLSRDPRRRPLVYRASVEPRTCTDRVRASAKIVGPGGERTVELEKFFALPTVDPKRENLLKPGEIITEVIVPAPSANAR